MNNEAIDKLIVDARIYDDPVRAHADLALMEETADEATRLDWKRDQDN